MTQYSPYADIMLATATCQPTCIIRLQSLLHFTGESVSVLYLNLKRDPSRVKSLRLALPVVGWRSRKKAWLSTAHFHRCLQLLELASWNTKVCSCSRPCTVSKTTEHCQRPWGCDCAYLYEGVCLCDRIQTWSSSSTTTNVSRLFLKSSRVILGLDNTSNHTNQGHYISTSVLFKEVELIRAVVPEHFETVAPLQIELAFHSQTGIPVHMWHIWTVSYVAMTFS